MKLTRTFCTFSDSALGVGTGACAGGAVEDDALPFMTSGACATSADPLGTSSSTSYSLPLVIPFQRCPGLCM